MCHGIVSIMGSLIGQGIYLRGTTCPEKNHTCLWPLPWFSHTCCPLLSSLGTDGICVRTHAESCAFPEVWLAPGGRPSPSLAMNGGGEGGWSLTL